MSQESIHDVPTMAQLVESVREWLERDVLTSTSGRVQFHTRVAMNVLGMVERELLQGATQAKAHESRLASLGMSDDAQLAQAIRNGDLDTRIDEVVAAVKDTVISKVSVANPSYLVN